MRVKTSDLVEGCILLEDVFNLASQPIIKKNTVLTDQLIEVLHLFLISTVEVSETLVNGSPFIPEAGEMEDQKIVVSKARTKLQKDKSFTTLFLEATKEYKRHYQSWQSGVSIDIVKVRNFLSPLLDEKHLKPKEMSSLHHLSNIEEYVYQHAVAIAVLSAFIAKQLKYPKHDIMQVALAGLLADCGMAKVDPKIFEKGAELTLAEFEEIKKHPQYSYELVQQVSLLKEGVKVAIFQHHERIDGSGYPLGIKNEKIHPISKIIAVADTFHAMTSERLYRTKQSPFKVLEAMQHDSFGKFDLLTLRALSEGVVQLLVGSKIKLSNGERAEVLFVDEKSLTRPLIQLVNSGTIINLVEHRALYIEEIL